MTQNRILVLLTPADLHIRLQAHQAVRVEPEAAAVVKVGAELAIALVDLPCFKSGRF